MKRSIEHLYPLMYQNAYNILLNHHDAEDAITETFIRIINHADHFAVISQEEVTALVVIYTRNASKTFYRRRQKYAASSLTVYEDEASFETKQIEVADPDENLDRMVINKETIELFSKELQKLGEDQRDTLMLRHYYRYSYSEISRVLGINEPAARARVYRAKEKLRELMGGEMYERIKF